MPARSDHRLDALPVSAHADGRDPEVGLAQTAVLHLLIEIQDVAPRGLFLCAGGRFGGGDAAGQHRGAAYEFAPVQVVVAHAEYLETDQQEQHRSNRQH